MTRPTRDRWIGDLFEGPVFTASCPVTDCEDDLMPEERAIIASAVPKRRREFAAGRRCARELLAQLGHPGFPLLRNTDRTPRWPAEIVGSISHSGTLCVAAIAARASFTSLGVDVEPDAALAPRLWRRICTAAELEQLGRSAPVAEHGRLVRLVFSAKEATYKSVHPLVGTTFGLLDIEIRIDSERRRFTPRLADTVVVRLPGGRAPEGSFARRDGFVFAAARIPAL